MLAASRLSRPKASRAASRAASHAASANSANYPTPAEYLRTQGAGRGRWDALPLCPPLSLIPVRVSRSAGGNFSAASRATPPRLHVVTRPASAPLSGVGSPAGPAGPAPTSSPVATDPTPATPATSTRRRAAQQKQQKPPPACTEACTSTRTMTDVRSTASTKLFYSAGRRQPMLLLLRVD